LRRGNKNKTAGELSIKAASDKTKYQSMEVAMALTADIEEQLYICAANHNPIFAEEEYCIGYVLATDPLIHNVMRRKFFAMLYLPSPRPSQTIFLYNKTLGRIVKRLWCLPNAMTMAELSSAKNVHPSWGRMKGWCDAFFKLQFWPYIRKESGTDMLSETEYLQRYRKELIAASPNQVNPLFTEPLDPVQAMINKVIHSDNIVLSKDILDHSGQTQNPDGDIGGHIPQHRPIMF
jgi:hypothetical protein